MRRVAHVALLAAVTALVGCSPDAGPLAPPSSRPGASLSVTQEQGASGQVSVLANFFDGFESPTFRPVWSTTQNFGTVTLTSNPAFVHAGNQAVQFASSAGGQRDMHLTAHAQRAGKGTVSVYFYDFAAGQQTLYEYLILSNSAGPSPSATVGITDYDAFCYIVSFVNSNGIQSGPNQNCGIFPQLTTTNVARTVGWHLYKIVVGANTIEFWIDQTLAYSAPGDYRFDTVDLTVSGPVGRPDTFAYFDDFRVLQ